MDVAEPVDVRGWRAELELTYEERGGRTVLARRRHEGPLVVQKPLYPEGDAVCHTLLVHPPGGIAGGDELQVDATSGGSAHVLLTTPAAGKWYRSAGPWAHQRVVLKAAAKSCVEWLPQETILFDGARANIETHVDLAEDASFIGWDILCLGRAGSGERFVHGDCRLHTRVMRAGKPLWFERALIAAGGLFCTSHAGLGGHTVCGTLLAAGAGVDKLVNACRNERAAAGATGVTCVPGVLVARYLGNSSEAVRMYFQRLWKHIRPALTGRDAHEPRIWKT
ncbi:MAG TPA: urease accessory protein UreD [Burkholderiales bacterium]|nr:urease accessory protein UreD [Burkholderiales bacterium]